MKSGGGERPRPPWRLQGAAANVERGEEPSAGAPGALPGAGDASWRDLLRGNVLWLSLVSLLNDTASEMIFPLLPLFLVTTLGAGPAVLGVVEGVAETTASLVKLAGGWLLDRLGRRRALVAWGYGIAALARPLLALATLPLHVLAVRFTDRVGKGVRTAPRDALLAGSVPAHRRGRAFGLHRAADHAGAVLGPLLASGLLLLYPGRLRLVFALALIPGLLAVAIVVAKVREVGPGPRERAAHPQDTRPPRGRRPGGPDTSHAPTQRHPNVQDASLPPVPGRPHAEDASLPPALRRYLLVLVVFTLGNASDAFLLLRAQELGVSVAAIPLLWGGLHVGKSAFNVLGGWLADRAGPRGTMTAGWLLYAATYAGFAWADAAWHAWGLFLAYGLYYGLTEAPGKTLVASLAGPSRLGTAFGAFHFAVGVAALPASIIFGVLWEGWGARPAFLVGAGLALAAAALLWRALPSRR